MWVNHRSLFLRLELSHSGLPWWGHTIAGILKAPAATGIWGWSVAVKDIFLLVRRCAEKSVAMDIRDLALVEVFPSAWWPLWEGQSWKLLSVAGMCVPVMTGRFSSALWKAYEGQPWLSPVLVPRSRFKKTNFSKGLFLVGWQGHVG